MTDQTDKRSGEVQFAVDPAKVPDASLAYIGRVRSPWTERSQCPRNLREARERGSGGRALIDPPFRPALEGLNVGDWVHLLTWLDRSRRDLALQMPRHAERPKGTFALRSPVRPNPIGLHLVHLVEIDLSSGVLTLDAIDVLDGTPLIDLKPYLPGVDRPPET
ncbi:tRNA (N6-threonylcarbamoyladenosine(37)-N6)-methyltransferase TrmO [Aureimonas phyllosphaerae]|uniref:tRNA (N6-threonylcarbamoyladenosine(37)-N6)-methyltransferase TrmO n=1 Tax=Aureimonas phyllosphaerae TaxID=1166078 RepID=UPI003A5C119A